MPDPLGKIGKKLKLEGGFVGRLATNEDTTRETPASTADVNWGLTADAHYKLARQDAVHEHIGGSALFFPSNTDINTFLVFGFASNYRKDHATFDFNLGVGLHWASGGYWKGFMLPVEMISVEVGYNGAAIKAGAIIMQRTNNKMMADPFVGFLVSINEMIKLIV